MSREELEQQIRRAIREAPDPGLACREIIQTVRQIADEEAGQGRSGENIGGRLAPFVSLPGYRPGKLLYRVPLSEPPGRIRPGQVLLLQGSKLETFQPEGTPLGRMVHPLTVQIPLEDPRTHRVRRQTGLRWVVMRAEESALVLVPISLERIRELTGRNQR